MRLADPIRGRNGTGEVASARVAKVGALPPYVFSNPSNFSTSNPPGLKIGPPLRDAPTTVVVAKQPEPLPELSPEESSNIRAWLEHIEETDLVIIAEVLDKCRTNLEARRYFLKRLEEMPEAITINHPMTCGGCVHFERIDHPCLSHCAKSEPEVVWPRHAEQDHLNRSERGEGGEWVAIYLPDSVSNLGPCFPLFFGWWKC